MFLHHRRFKLLLFGKAFVLNDTNLLEPNRNESNTDKRYIHFQVLLLFTLELAFLRSSVVFQLIVGDWLNEWTKPVILTSFERGNVFWQFSDSVYS